MKFIKNLVLTVLLASILGVSAFAGEQSTPGIASPTPSPSPEGAMTTSDDGIVCYPSDGNTETSDYLFYEALAALLSVY